MTQEIQTGRRWLQSRSMLLGICLWMASAGTLLAQAQLLDPKSQPEAEGRVTFAQQPPSAPAQQTQTYNLPNNDCSAEYWYQYYYVTDSTPSQAASAARIPSKELVQPMSRVQELPDERVKSMPRIGED